MFIANASLQIEEVGVSPRSHIYKKETQKKFLNDEFKSLRNFMLITWQAYNTWFL